MFARSFGRHSTAVLVVAVLSMSASGLHASEVASREVLARFSAGSLDGWEPKSFSGQTDYRFVTIDNETVLEATSNSSASGLVMERTIDLDRTPILVWRWRVEKPVQSPADEQSKNGDDFAVRVYFIVPGRGFLAFPDSVSYVWSRSQSVGVSWKNPYTDKVRMIAVDSGTQHAGAWRVHRRNMREDFRRLFARDTSEISHIAIMTDTDNTKTEARAWYGDVWVEPAP